MFRDGHFNPKQKLQITFNNGGLWRLYLLHDSY